MKWTEKEVTKLHERKAKGMSWQAIAKAHNRTESACRQKFYKTQELCQPHNTTEVQLELPFYETPEPEAGSIIWHEPSDQYEAMVDKYEQDSGTGLTSRIADMAISFVAGIALGLSLVIIINSL